MAKAAFHSTRSCLVSKLAREFIEQERNDALLSGSSQNTDDIKWLVEEANAHVTDRMNAIAELAKQLPAKSVEGAMFQLSILGDVIEQLENIAVNDGKHPSPNLRREADRLLYSVLAVFKKATGISPNHYYTPKRCDPFRKTAETLASVAKSG